MGGHVGGCALSDAVCGRQMTTMRPGSQSGLVVVGVEHDDATDGVPINLLDRAVVHDERICGRVPLFDLEVLRLCEECKRCGMSD